jgi:hypothetical protein
VVSIGIFYTGAGIVRDNVSYLVGAAPPDDLRREILERALDHPRVRGAHDVVAHYVGPEVDVSLHIEVEGHMSLFEAHDIESEVVASVQATFGRLQTYWSSPFRIGSNSPWRVTWSGTRNPTGRARTRAPTRRVPGRGSEQRVPECRCLQPGSEVGRDRLGPRRPADVGGPGDRPVGELVGDRGPQRLGGRSVSRTPRARPTAPSRPRAPR